MKNLYYELCGCSPLPRPPQDYTYNYLPYLTGANGKKIEEVRGILISIREKEEQLWGQVMRQWGPAFPIIST
jgi:hypothetical protein